MRPYNSDRCDFPAEKGMGNKAKIFPLFSDRETHGATGIGMSHLAIGNRCGHSIHIVRRLGYDVDNSKFGISSVCCRAGTADDFDPIDLLQRKMIAKLQCAIKRLVELLAIDQQKDLSFVGPASADSYPDSILHIQAGTNPGTWKRTSIRSRAPELMISAWVITVTIPGDSL